MYSYEDRIRAVTLYIKLGKRTGATIRQLGYPTKNSLKSWHEEYERRLDLSSGYVRSKPPVRPKLDPFTAIIDKMLADDKSRPKKQQHTSKRIFERLRDEHGFTGKVTIVKDYVAGLRRRSQEMFVPLVRWPRLFGQNFRCDKWRLCRG